MTGPCDDLKHRVEWLEQRNRHNLRRIAEQHDQITGLRQALAARQLEHAALVAKDHDAHEAHMEVDRLRLMLRRVCSTVFGDGVGALRVLPTDKLTPIWQEVQAELWEPV